MKKFIIILACFAAINLLPIYAFADSGTIVNAANGNSYQRIDTQMDWHSAKSYCESQGGHLATITSQQENDFIGQNFIVSGVYDHLWLGTTDEADESTWRWVTGENWDFTYWNNDEPNGGTSENYLEMRHFAHDSRLYVWNDYPNSREFSFVCEWESTPGSCNCDAKTGFWVPAGELNLGTGIFIEIKQDTMAFGWGAFKSDGASTYVFAEASRVGTSSSFSGNLLKFENGPTFAGPPTPTVNIISAGSITVTFTSDTTGIITGVVNGLNFNKAINRVFGSSGGGCGSPANVIGTWTAIFSSGGVIQDEVIFSSVSQSGSSFSTLIVSSDGWTSTATGQLCGSILQGSFINGEGSTVSIQGTVSGNTVAGVWSSTGGTSGAWVAIR